MSNPTFKTGPISFPAAEDVKRFRLVTLAADGVKHASAAGPVFGAVTATASKATDQTTTDPNVLNIGSPHIVAAHFAPSTVPIETTGDATAIKKGTALFAAADGKVSTTGTVYAGIAVRDGRSGRVEVLLAAPTAPAPAGG